MSTLMSADADADSACGAPYGRSSPDRATVRNGYRHREFDTRAGVIDLAVPTLREGSYCPGLLLEHRRRAERALTIVSSPPAIRSASRPDGWRNWSRPSGSLGCPSRGSG